MDIILERYVIVILAVLSSGIFVLKRQWENVITHSMIAIVFICVIIGVPFESATTNMLIRWLFILLLLIEVISWATRTFTKDNKHGRG